MSMTIVVEESRKMEEKANDARMDFEFHWNIVILHYSKARKVTCVL